jgi:pimeloyl-ACP methyl ester carboxylesterase
VLPGCGGSAPHPARIEGPFGSGRAQFWIARSTGQPRAVVALLHGLSPDSGLQLRAWILHLARTGDDVVFPRYEQPSPDPDARDGVVEGVRGGLAELGKPRVPLVLVGHSRGGRLAVEAAATLHPAAAIAVFPGRFNPQFEEQTELGAIPRRTRITLLVGDRDRDVGPAGAIELFTRLREAGVPSRQIAGGVIRSRPGFSATHMSVYRTDAPARRAVWQRVDRLIAQAAGA